MVVVEYDVGFSTTVVWDKRVVADCSYSAPRLGGVAVYSNLGSFLPLSGELFSHWSAKIQPNARQYIRAHGFLERSA